MLRQPAVAGSFYPGDKARLTTMLEGLLVSDLSLTGVLGAVSPHAGYMYSGPAAGSLFASFVVPRTVVIIGPNHKGMGANYAIFDAGSWRTPMGDVPVDEQLAAKLKKNLPFLKSDTSAHLYEHSIEVQVPFLQERRKDVTIVPICVGEHNFARLLELGNGLAAAIGESSAQTLLLASSDMTHYESADSAGRKDRMAIERMLALDEEGLWETVTRHNISMCGVAPAVSVIAASRALGAVEGKLIRYMTSGDVTGDSDEVVGYASLVFVGES
jgi:AmmeMemoRadiSam system protein B